MIRHSVVSLVCLLRRANSRRCLLALPLLKVALTALALGRPHARIALILAPVTHVRRAAIAERAAATLALSVGAAGLHAVLEVRACVRVAASRQALVVSHAEVPELLASKEADTAGYAFLAGAAPAALLAILVELALRAKRVGIHRAISAARGRLHVRRWRLLVLCTGIWLSQRTGAARLAQRQPLAFERHRWC